MNKYKLIIFDMDGTTLNTLDDLHDSLNYALKVCGYPGRTLNEVRTFVGNGIRRLIELGVPDFADIKAVDNVHAAFGDYYPEHCYDKTMPYGGITEVLKCLRENGYKTACVSNKDDSAVQILTQRFFCGLFDFSVGSKAGIRKKPYPDTVNEVLKFFNISRENAVYVGDSEVDIETAKNSRMDCIAVSWGFREKDELIKNGATVIADKPEDILLLIK